MKLIIGREVQGLARKIIGEEMTTAEKIDRKCRQGEMKQSDPGKKEIATAAQLWCRPEFSKKVMDPDFAIAIAEELKKARLEAIEEAAMAAENSKGPDMMDRLFIANEIRKLKEGR